MSFEPNPILARRLSRVTPPNVRVEASALSNRSGEAELLVPSGRGPDALATLRDMPLDDGERIEVPLVRLDDFRLDDVGFVKIDVEGHEHAVLQGATSTIQRCHPNILIELESRCAETPIDVTMRLLIDDLGYEGWYLRGRTWTPLAEFDVDRDQLARASRPKSTSYINNFVFVPQGSGPPDPV